MFKGALSGLRQFLANENSFKMMKNAFYFTLKALPVLRIYKFLIIYKNGLIRKIRLITKFMTSQPEKTTFGIHILQDLPDQVGAGGHASPPIFLKQFFAGDIFLEICFCFILQDVQNFFGPDTPRISSRAMYCPISQEVKESGSETQSVNKI